MLTLPDVRQKASFDCGAACAAAVCQYYGLRCSLADATRGLITSPIDGTDPRALESWLRRQGLQVLAGEMDLADLDRQTKRGRPVILVLASHYVVACGVKRGRVFIHDPESGLQMVPSTELLAMWCEPDRLGASYWQFGISVWRSDG